MKTLKQIFEQLENDPLINQKVQQMNIDTQKLQKQANELNMLLKKKAIDDSEYKKRMELINKQLLQQKEQLEKNKNLQNPAANPAANPGGNQNVNNV